MRCQSYCLPFALALALAGTSAILREYAQQIWNLTPVPVP